MLRSVFNSPFYWLATVGSTSTLLILGLFMAWVIVPVPAKYHRTTFFEFSLPVNWLCEEEGSETVCISNEENKQAIIIFAAKLRNKEDNLKDYYDYLSKVKTYKTPDNTTVDSSVVHVTNRPIGKFNWVDGLHYQSEIPGFYTQYLATNTAQLGIVITFSYHKDASKKTINALEQSINNLHVYVVTHVSY